MKTAISLDGNLLTEADKTARAMGLSRSRLFSLAIEDYLRRRQEQHMLDKLNQVYGDQPDPDDAPIPKKLKAKFRATIQDRW